MKYYNRSFYFHECDVSVTNCMYDIEIDNVFNGSEQIIIIDVFMSKQFE